MPPETTQLTGRRRVLDSAAELFVAQGYVGTTLRQIAAATGMKAGSIYHHFDSKEALFVSVLNQGMTVMVDAFEETARSLNNVDAADATDATDAAVLAHVRAHLSAVFEHGPYTTVHVTSFFSAPLEVRIQVVPLRDGYEEKWNELFERLFPHTNTKDLRVHRLILFGAMNTAVEWFDQSGNLTLDQLASTITNQFLHGVEA